MNRNRMIGYGLIVVGIVVVVLALAFSARATTTTTATSYQGAMYHATNHARVVHGRHRLGPNACLQSYAEKQAAAQARSETMYHQFLANVLIHCHLSAVGENVGYGYPTGRALVWRGWMRSPEHRANILTRRWRMLGVGARRGADGLWYASELMGYR